MLALDFVLYSCLAYYVDQINSEFGVHKPWNFLCTKKYWTGNKKNSHKSEYQKN